MRTAGLLIFLVACVVSGCKAKSEADASPDPAAIEAQQKLLARRDALLKARQQLQADRDKIELQINEVQTKGDDASDLIKKRTDLDTEIKKSNDDQLQEVNGKLDALKVTGDKTAQVAARETEIGIREKTIADRESRLAEREHEFVKLQAEAAQRWKDSCSAGPPMIIQQAAPTKGGTYTKKDVSDLIGKAKSAMARKGITTGDLPGPAQSLEAEAGKALNENDMSKAYFAAAQLSGTVDSIQVNRAFIQAKHARLSAVVKNSKVDDATNQQLASILGDVMQKYNDGDFAAANKRLNQLGGLLKQ